MIKLSVITVNYRGWVPLERCLNSLLSIKSENFSLEVIIVDNFSNDGKLDEFAQKFPKFKFIKSEGNYGFAYGNNLGARHATGDFLLFLNPDTIVEKDVVETLINFLENNTDIGAVGPRLLNPDRTLQESAYPEPTLAREFWRLFHLDRFYYYAKYPMDEWSLIDARGVDVLMGACLLVRRRALNQVGLLDDNFFVYSEELCFIGYYVFFIN